MNHSDIILEWIQTSKPDDPGSAAAVVELAYVAADLGNALRKLHQIRPIPEQSMLGEWTQTTQALARLDNWAARLKKGATMNDVSTSVTNGRTVVYHITVSIHGEAPPAEEFKDEAKNLLGQLLDVVDDWEYQTEYASSASAVMEVT